MIGRTLFGFDNELGDNKTISIKFVGMKEENLEKYRHNKMYIFEGVKSNLTCLGQSCIYVCGGIYKFADDPKGAAVPPQLRDLDEISDVDAAHMIQKFSELYDVPKDAFGIYESVVTLDIRKVDD